MKVERAFGALACSEKFAPRWGTKWPQKSAASGSVTAETIGTWKHQTGGARRFAGVQVTKNEPDAVSEHKTVAEAVVCVCLG